MDGKAKKRFVTTYLTLTVGGRIFPKVGTASVR